MLEAAEGPGPDALVSVVADNVRSLRERAGLSLSELAVEAGVGKSTLSQLESGRANPSIETLWAIARALSVPFGRLIELAVPDVHVVRAGDGVRVDAADAPYHARLLASRTRRGAFELYRIDAEPGPARDAEGHIGGAVEHVLVLAGRMRVGPHDAAVELGPGDLASFAGDVRHVYQTLEPATQALLLMDYR